MTELPANYPKTNDYDKGVSTKHPLCLAFESRPITILADEAGELWWFADEVCASLGIADHKQSIRHLDDDEKGIHIADTPGGPQRKATINESGLYSLILRSRKPEAKRFKKWVTSEVLPAIRKTGTYNTSTLATREADLSALTDAVSAIVPALTAITTTLAALSDRVTALEARPVPTLTAVPHSGLGELVLRHFAPTGNHPHGARWMTNPEIRTAIRPGAWTRSEVIALTKALDRLGFGSMRKHGNVRVWATFQAPALPAPRMEIGPFDHLADQAALPAPQKDGVQPLRVGRVRIKDGVPFEVYSGPVVDDRHLANVETDFAKAFPGWHLGRDWRSAGGWPGEAAPADAGMVARPRRAGIIDQPARVIDDEDGQPVAVEWKGQRSQRELDSMSAELRRLRYSAGPWKRVAGGYRAELH